MMKLKLWLMPKEPTWWVWLVIAMLLAVGLAGFEPAYAAAIALSGAQTVWMLARHRAWSPYPVQIRAAYTACLFVYLLPGLNWMFWIPMLGTFALVLFGYCLMARLLSLMPWNRAEPFSLTLVKRALLTPPMPGRAEHGLPASAGCPGGVCELEARAASARP